MINDTPYDGTTHSNPWLINTNKDQSIIGPDGLQLTAEYIWSKRGKDREDLVNWVFKYYRDKGFFKSPMNNLQLNKEYDKLKKKNPNEVLVDGFISNSSSLCNDVYKHFVWDKYYSARGKEGSKSVIEVFNNDELLKNVIKNRMGYCLSKEDGEERPYVFAITDKMIVQSIHSTGLGYNVSLFKPIVGKFLYNLYAKKKVFDYSAGWGARCLAAMSLGLEYYGVDPLTSDNINEIINFFDGKGFVINGCSEDKEIYKFPMVDCVLSCPPYFNLEIYSDDQNQSTNKFKDYNDWLILYWEETVKNCLSLLECGGHFVLIIKETVDKYNLANDMLNLCLKSGLQFINEHLYKTSTNHLSGKKTTGRIAKNNEKVLVFRK